MHPQHRPFTVQLFLDFYAISFPRWPLIFFGQHDSPSNLAESRYPRHEPRSRAFYYSINSLLHTWNSYYTEPPMKVPITPHRLESMLGISLLRTTTNCYFSGQLFCNEVLALEVQKCGWLRSTKEMCGASGVCISSSRSRCSAVVPGVLACVHL